MDYRVGVGYDLHRLVAGRRLLLGGLEIPHESGLLGHSDADVVLHAVADALLGAAGLPDIGEFFPDTDPRWAGADSRLLLGAALEQVRAAGFAPHNLDCIVHAERPRMSPYKRPMAESLAALLGLSAGQVAVKAKTGEGLGSIGSGAAVACTAVVLIKKAS